MVDKNSQSDLPCPPSKYGRFIPPKNYKEWEEDCLKWRGAVLTGEFSHWCFDWDGLPMDETCREWDTCHCCDAERPDRKA